MGLRRALLALLLPGLTALMGLELAVSWRSALDAANAAFDRSLLGAIKAMDANVSTASGGLSVELPFRMLEFFALTANGEVFYRVASADGLVEIGHSDMPAPAQTLVDGRPQFHDALYQGVPVRLGSYARRLAQPLAGGSNSDRLVIQVAETLDSRRDFTRQLMLQAAARDTLLLGAGLAWLILAVSAVLRPLNRLRQQLLARRDDDLSAIDDGPLPADVRPLVQALNQVLQHYDAALAARRRFVDDASHQLRTPLAVLRTQVAYARREADPQRVQQALQAIHAQVEDAIRQTNQMLALARADSAACELQAVQASALATELVRAHWPLARERSIDLGLQADAPQWVWAHPAWLSEALSNLLHNAINHTPAGSQVTLSVQPAPDAAGWVAISVSDNGPGLSALDLAHAGERFYRGAGAASGGSGLGLAIVHAIVQRLGARLQLHAAQPQAQNPGLAVTLSLPLAPQPAPETPDDSARIAKT